LGENDLTRIDIVGEELRRLKFKVKLPQEEIRQSFPLLEIIGAEKACSGCLIPLLSGLRFLSEQAIFCNFDKRSLRLDLRGCLGIFVFTCPPLMVAIKFLFLLVSKSRKSYGWKMQS
jgi:hypothetical protein